MRFGIHLPQAGPAASRDAIIAAARQAEDLGFDDVWVSDHVVVPREREYPPSAYIQEPIVTMAVAAAVTQRVGIGTTVLVVPMRQPVVLAKQLASIDQMSNGRVILGAAAGWLESEFQALSANFAERGAVLNESIDLMRAIWSDDPITHSAPLAGAELRDMRAKPQPSHPIPIWIGGHSAPVYRRAIEVGDGWHGAFKSPSETADIVATLRAGRPEEGFVISMRTRWDALNDDRDLIIAELEEFAAVGVQHIVAEPQQRTQEAWLRCGEAFAEILQAANI
jgi:probable F420-dependent oxidoreductase